MDALNQEWYTMEDIEALPEGQRAELIDGRMYMMATPGRIHQRISWKLHQSIANYIDSKNGDCEVYAAPFSVFLFADDKTYVEPDLSVICDKSKLDDRGCNGAPDWVIEIVSPSSRMMDYYKKLFLYRAAGVREYWIVDPDKKRVMVYTFEKDGGEEYSLNDEIPVGIYEDFVVQLDVE